MFRRTRLSVKPNVKTSIGGRGVTAGTQPLHPLGTQQSSHTVDNEGPLVDSHEQPTAASSSAQSNTEQSARSSPERTEATAGISDASESIKPSSALLQRRKRISTAPNLAKPRASVPLAQQPSTSTLKLLPAQDSVVVPPSTRLSVAKEVSEPPKNTLPVSPKIRVAHKFSVGQQSSLPEKRTPVPQVPQFSPFKKSSSKDANRNLLKDDGPLQKDCSSLLKERPTQEDTRLEETAGDFKSAPKKNQRSDRERILKAQKLRELLRQELKKEKKDWKEKHPIIESTIPPDRSRMTMRDFIYYLPDANPMKSAFEKEKKSEKCPSIQIQAKEPEEKSANRFEPEDELEEDENDEGPLLVPRVKVAEDGTIILDEESLTVEVLRAKGPIVEENDPIFERGSTTTYSSFKKSNYSKPWSNKETDMFFLAISMVGTDFSLIGQLFPHRERIEIKNKFKREERSNGWRIDKAFKEKKPFDFEFFAKLLKKILAEEAERKQKSVKNKTTPEKKKHKPGSKKGKSAGGNAAKSSKHSEYADNSDTEATDINARIAEKENEESPNVPEGQTVSGSSKKKKKKKKMNDSEKVPVNPAEEDIPPDLSVAQVKIKKKKRQSMEEAGADTGDPIICLEQSELEYSGRHQEGDILVDDRPGCTSPESEKVGYENDSPSSAENTTNMENEKPVAILPAPQTRGRVQKPKPNLGKAVVKNVEVEMESAEGKQTEPEIHHTDGEDTVLEAASGKSQPDLAFVISEELPEDCQTVVENSPGNQSKTAVEHHRSEEENKSKSVIPSRGRFHKPKPNFRQSPGSKGTASVANVDTNEDATNEEVANEEMGHEDPGDSSSSSADHSRKAILDKEESISPKKSPRYHNSTKLELIQQPEDDAGSHSLGSPFHCTRSPGGIVQSGDSTGTCTTSTKEESKQLSFKMPTRGRFQRPKPNLRQAPGRKETAIVAKVPEEEDASATKEVMKEGGIFEKEESFSARKSPRYHSSTKLELLQQSEDSACSASLDSQPSPALCPLDLVQNIASTDTCRTDIEGESEPQSVKQPTRGRFQRPKPNVRPAPGRKETATVAKVPEKENASATEEVVNEEFTLEKEEMFSARKSPRCHNSTTLPVQQQPQDSAYSASLCNPLQCGGQLTSAFSPCGSIQSEASIDTCRTSFEAEIKPPFVKLPTRGWLQRPKPNLRQASGRKETATMVKPAEEEGTTATEDTVNEEDKLDKEESFSSRKSPRYHNSTKPELLQQPEDGACSASLGRSLECVAQLSAFSPGGLVHTEASTDNCKSDPCPISSPEQHKSESPKPVQLRRGRFQKPRPNLGMTVGRRSTALAGKVTADYGKSDGEKTENSLKEHDGRESTSQPALASKSGAREATVSSLCSSSPAEQNSLLVKSNLPENLLECSSQEEQEYLHPSNDHESNSNSKAGLDTKSVPQMCSKENAIKPTPLLRGRFHRPKPNLAIATERKELPAEGKNVISNKEDTDVDTGVTCHAVLDQLTYAEHNSDPNKAVSASVGLLKRKAPVDEPGAVPGVSPKRGRRCNIQTAKGPMSKSEKEQLNMSPPATICAAVAVKTARQGKKCKFLDPEEPTSQRKASEPPCEPEHSEQRKTILKRKPTTVKGLKNINGRSAGKKHVVLKRTLVTLRASSQEDDDDDDDVDADIDYGEENDDLAPEEINKAPVFVPKGLRSPNPVAVTIEETMEEFDMSYYTSGSEYVTDVSNLPSYLCEEKEVNNVYTNENSMMQLNISTPHIATEEEKETFDGNTEAALILLAIGDPVFQAKENMQRASDEPDEQREISIDLQNHDPVQPMVTESSPSHVPVVSVTKDPSTVQRDDRLDLKTDIPSCKETLSSELKVAVPSKPLRSRFPKPKPNLGRAVGIKRSGQQNPVIQPMEQANEDQSKGPPVEGTLTVHSIEQKNDQSKLVTNTSAGLDELKEDIIEQQGQKTQRCERREDIFKSNLSCETIEECMVTPSEHSSCQSSESGHSLQDTGPFEVSSCTHWEQEEHLGQHQNITITYTGQNEAENIDSEEQTFILTLVEIPNVSVEGYDAEDAFSNSEDSLPAPQFVSPTNNEIQYGTQAQSNENVKALADMHVDAPCDQLSPSQLLQEFQKPRKRNACVPEKNVIPAKKMTPNTIQDVSCKNMFDNAVEEMPLEPPIIPDIVEKRTVTNWKSKTFESLEVKPSLSKSSDIRPARKPLGFLPLICKKPDSENDIVNKNNQRRVVPSSMTTPKPGLKRLPSLRNPLDAQAPSTSAASRLDYNRWRGNTTYPPAAAQCEVTAKAQEQRNVSSPKATEPEKEPTGISEFFFGDIFTEVNDCD